MSARDARRSKRRKTIRRRSVTAAHARRQSKKARDRRYGRALRKILRGSAGADSVPRYDQQNTLAYRHVHPAWRYV